MTFKFRYLLYPVIGVILWLAFQAYITSLVHQTDREERAGRVAEAILSTAKKYRQSLESARAQSTRDRAAARQSDARSRQVEDSNKVLQAALAPAVSYTDSAAATTGDTGSAGTWRSLYVQRTGQLAIANVIIHNGAVSLGECRNTVASLARDTLTSSNALNACAARVDSLTLALDSLYRVKQCRILFVTCPSRKTSFLYGAAITTAGWLWLTSR